ncbi:hypothetical protein L208DRAFT_1533671, partial [Tricholoma matsutake]
MNLTIVSGTRLFFRLCSSHSVTALGNAPLMSRKRINTTFPFLHTFLTWCISKCTASVMLLQGLPLKCVSSNSWCCSITEIRLSEIIDVNTLAIVHNRAMGQYALGTS